MLRDRNEASHVYDEEIHVYDEEMARRIYGHIKEYFSELERTYHFLMKRFENQQ